jgi:hypothetical protein
MSLRLLELAFEDGKPLAAGELVHPAHAKRLDPLRAVRRLVTRSIACVRST